ncbi:MAG: hypothetical protein U5L96_10565 [Owenweeksia sp.]|nr:hypothetical protein [Owenweeksia sp.]
MQVTDNLFYHYLTSYRAAIQKLTRFYIRLVGFGMPLAGIPVIYVFQDQKQPDKWQEIIDISPCGQPLLSWVLFAILLSGSGIASFCSSLPG